MRWGNYPGSYPGGPSVLTRVLKKREAGESESGKETGQRGRSEDAMRVAWEMRKGPQLGSTGRLWKLEKARNGF